ncbi:VCBS repeat-containing protein [Ichthyenterobacterium magnum]|uniref:VCBS repeat protein n=1 Tax=Ichthyenterobacterium magnum TaxID=1230530 RepID=A0A420DGP5_9FLAO|nr:VCBS repeat-containing protein [Ichthyenterobacterium magnum]RKE92261.1 VCBS repeat protein [Ichthyenterobacterium magnum]
MNKIVYTLLTFLIISSCAENKKENLITKSKEDAKLFSLIKPTQSNITFSNNLKETYEFNFLVYPYIYIGGGVAVGDINNDGLQDIYFTSNQNSNKLYLNKGDLKFDDITIASNTSDSDGWSTGTSMIDINNDGYLDIYVCKSASLKNKEARRNKLYINQKDNSFKESAKSYGLDHPGFSTQSYFFDYDKDGDLDMYLVNHRPDFKNNTKISSEIQSKIYDESSDHLFRNDGNTFTKVSASAGIINKAWGLSASIGDFNNDNWPDIYVANDYLEPDMLYINNKNGSFKNEILDRVKHISFNSMGSDFADINNDLLPDLITLDMLAEDHSRGKENMATMSTENFNNIVKVGYHHQYMANTMQLNNGNGSFSDIGQLSGISKTDWSWAPLIADFDNDGLKDVFITNGIEKDFANQDFRRNIKKLNQQNKAMKLEDVLNMLPAAKLANYIFKNNGDLTFSNQQKNWGLDQKVNSNGAAYADFDNDGDLDLIVNNENAIASLYQNNSTNNYLNIKLNGNDKNKFAIGTTVKITTNKGQQLQQLYTNRGFQSSVTNILNFGIGNQKSIKSLEVIWPDGKISNLNNIDANQLVEIDYTSAKNKNTANSKSNNNLFAAINSSTLSINYKHDENLFDDYSKQLLLPNKQSTQGPCLSVADVNGDGLDDFYVGGAHKQSAQLYIQSQDKTFKLTNNSALIKDKNYEDVESLFFDSDNDGDLDLYVCSSGYELNENDSLLQDRLYLNDGKGNLTRSNKLPKMLSSTKAVKPIDYDDDGDLDLIVGGRVIPGKYPLAPQSYILKNDNGTFSDVTNVIAPDFKTIGMVTDIEITDYNNDKNLDVIIVGQWMPITLFSIENNKFIKQNIKAFEKTEGWYNSISASDFDNDGDIDYIIGNLGSNNKFHPTLEKPLHIFSSNFDNNQSYDIALSKYYKGQLVPVRGKQCSSEQTPFLNEKIGSYKEFASLNIEGVYGSDAIADSNHMIAYNFKTLYLKNEAGNFSISYLPNVAQISPTQDFEILDLNNDGFLDIVGIGNLYDAEVETIRYDASHGYALLNDGKGHFNALKNSGLFCDKDMRQVSKIKIDNTPHIIIASNNDSLSIFKLK